MKLYVFEYLRDGQWCPKSLHRARNFHTLLNDLESLLGTDSRIRRVKSPEEAERLSKSPTLILTTETSEVEWI